MDETALGENAKQALLQSYELIETKNQLERFCRLTKHPDAIMAWHKLERKLSQQDDFSFVAKKIVGIAIRSGISPETTLTKQEIRESANEAARLADRLRHLIDFNFDLQPIDLATTPSLQQAALQRITLGLIYHAAKNDGAYFPKEIEQELDEIDRRPSEGEQFSEPLPIITTHEAYCILAGYGPSEAEDFKERLRLFASIARKAAELEPFNPRPKNPNAGLRSFAIHICYILNKHCGSPNYEIAAAFTRAAFDKEVDSELIKKWIKRERDSSME